MFAGIWAAYKTASPLIKYGAIGVLILFLIGSWYGYKQYLIYEGVKKERAGNEILLRQQAQESQQQAIKQSDLRQKEVSILSDEVMTLQMELRKIRDEHDQREQVKYAKPKPIGCPTDASTVQFVNDLAGVLNTPTSKQRVSSTDSPTEGPSPGGIPTVTAIDTTVYTDRIETLTEMLKRSQLRHARLWSYISNDYVEKYRYFYGKPPE